jgi:hypothetical protein
LIGNHVKIMNCCAAVTRLVSGSQITIQNNFVPNLRSKGDCTTIAYQ